jgi:hypothetical protein
LLAVLALQVESGCVIVGLEAPRRELGYGGRLRCPDRLPLVLRDQFPAAGGVDVE